MGQKNTPVGLGIWIAFQNSIGTVEKSIELLKLVGAKWVAPRAGEGPWRDSYWKPDMAREAIKKYHDAGIKVYPWIYSYPNSYTAEVPIFKALMEEGADGVFIDAEIEWQGHGQNKPAAESFMQKLRSELGDDCFIGHAPFPYVQWHLDFPYEEFGKYCDAVCDQLYWTEISNDTVKHHIAVTDKQWSDVLAKNPNFAKVRCPIGVTYGHELKNVKVPPPGEFRISDLEDFLDWCESKKLPFYSLYSLDSARPDAIETLRLRANPPDVPAAPTENGSKSPLIEASEGEQIQTQGQIDALVPAGGTAPWFIVLLQFITRLFSFIFSRKG